MACELYKYRKEEATHYVGCTGNEYPIKEYCNFGIGKNKDGKKDLPLNEYPYTIKYKIELIWTCCKLCSCDNKEKF